MTVATHVKSVVGDPLNPASLAGRARRRRWEMFQEQFPDLGSMRILDLGGYIARWRDLPEHPAEVVTLNLDPEAPPAENWARAVPGDACTPPEWLFGERFDLVYSNSLIEHVGGHQRRGQLAAAIHALAPHHWIQTPYRYFPIEPHFLAPGLQHLPRAVQAQIVIRWPIGNYGIVRDRATALRRLMGIELLSRSELAAYFPSATIERERFLGLTKSLIAVER